ncbi:hypothetical protein [Mycolicibacterium komossense]|uniref:alpha-L-rhamnosidase-related protein n=1 Tax=Mycolicibacterium komossense TaxID=1779 RepID=UPI0021F38EBC|nr:hypothetical protein [Mycolicibacterium komossense]
MTMRYLVAAAFLCRTTTQMVSAARVLVHSEDAAEFTDLAALVRRALRNEYVTPAGRLAGEAARRTRWRLPSTSSIPTSVVPRADDYRRSLPGPGTASPPASPAPRSSRMRSLAPATSTRPTFCSWSVTAGEHSCSYQLAQQYGARPEFDFATHLPGIPIDATAPEAAAMSLSTVLEYIPGAT